MATTPGDEQPARTLATFAVQAGPSFGQELPVTLPVVSIGRGSQNDLVLTDDSVSAAHARLEYEHGGWRLTDLESINGTFVEGIRLAPSVPTPLPYGASVRFGAVRLHFRAVEEADPEAARASYAPPRPPERLATRSGGFRLPVWVFLLVLLVLAAVAAFLVTRNDDPRPAEPVPETVSLWLPAAEPPHLS